MSRRERRRQQAIRMKAAPAGVLALQAIAGLAASGRVDEARAALTRTLTDDSIRAENVGEHLPIAQQLGMVAAFLGACRRLAERTENVASLIALGRCAVNARAFSDAAFAFERAVARAPESAEAHALYGVSLYQSGNSPKAREMLSRAIAIDPKNVLARNNLGSLLVKLGDVDGAIDSLGVAVSLDPANINAKLNLAEAFIKKEMYEEAFLLARDTLDAKETRERSFLVLSNIYRAICDTDRSIYYLKQAVDVTTGGDSITPYLFYLQASDTHTDEEVFAEHKRLARQFERPDARKRTHTNTPDPSRRLKVAFVSGDFYNHSVANFVTPLFRDLDKTKFEIYGLYNNGKTDTATLVLKDLADHWLNCMGMSDQALADWIEQEKIDILIDLSGHTGMHRLGTFGLKPAPVQATYLGYPGTTGLTAMDYRITCESLDPSGIAEKFHTEKLVRLPGIFAPFQPQGEAPIQDAPCSSGAPFTFACLNPIWRINPSVVKCWGKILQAVPDARMILGNVDTPMVAQRLVTLFANEGVSTERLVFQKRQQLIAYLQLHNQIDLGLDTFPYNGGTTTTYSLWMGAPVVALEGTRPAARTGSGILREAGLEDFIASTPEQYVSLAVEWAGRRDELQAMRHGLRARLKIGQTAEQAQVAADFGDALIGMWRAWCAEQMPVSVRAAS